MLPARHCTALMPDLNVVATSCESLQLWPQQIVWLRFVQQCKPAQVPEARDGVHWSFAKLRATMVSNAQVTCTASSDW
jgi:hypothetical protein